MREGSPHRLPVGQTDQGIEPMCYSRNVDIGGTLIFQPSTCFVQIVASIMTIIMILHIRSKYTAEIVMFFWMYLVIELLAMFLDSGIIPMSNPAYPWFAAIYTGLVAATYTCLLINGFVGFQFAEDGTPLSLWQLAGFKYDKPIALWVVYILWPLICTVVYVVSQLILVFRTLEDRWPIGDVIFGAAFWTIAQVLLFAFSVTICDAIKHYIDGLFFFTLCILLSVMMVYKIAAAWKVEDPLLTSAPMDHSEEDIRSAYHAGGGGAASLVGGVGSAQMYGGAAPRRGYPPRSGGSASVPRMLRVRMEPGQVAMKGEVVSGRICWTE
ncbi:chitin synthase export chaperone [Ephemerocybe angulata]|uniref:Chitin synthase export chaperone n=1 Tax=Ephemerocybe angulata TaxID=980116 RepID=A0A8H6M0A1_9AGAR|nr:chitin synthase export chaperone [Tulosesus angulatus]